MGKDCTNKIWDKTPSPHFSHLLFIRHSDAALQSVEADSRCACETGPNLNAQNADFADIGWRQEYSSFLGSNLAFFARHLRRQRVSTFASLPASAILALVLSALFGHFVKDDARARAEI